uniref:Cyclic nucleotide-binding domain-containing protein n=1 Tax=Macrostomum lignano TaxID=282301 RepID=A0A1I8J6V3_9PLAT
GESNEQICGQKDRNRSFFFVASGQLLHRQLSGDQHRRVVEQRLLELDCWGLECISTGREERICVTATSACRLFVLTSRRFFWLCRMAAERTHRLQLAVVDSMLQARLPSVEQVLGFAEPEADTSSGGAVMVLSLDQHTPGIHIPDQSIPKPAVQSKTPNQPPKSLLNAKGGLSRRVNYHLLDGLLHSIKQLDISSHRDPNGDSRSVLISCSTGQTMIVYCLTGCVRLILDHCNNFTSVVADNNVALTAGRAHEIGANQNWKMTNSLSEQEKQYQQTIHNSDAATIQSRSLLLQQRNLLPDRVAPGRIDVHNDAALVRSAVGQHGAPGIRRHAVAVGNVATGCGVAGWRADGSEQLILQGGGPDQQLPVRRPRRGVESARVHEKVAAELRQPGSHAGKPDIVADAQPDLGEWRLPHLREEVLYSLLPSADLSGSEPPIRCTLVSLATVAKLSQVGPGADHVERARHIVGLVGADPELQQRQFKGPPTGR